MLPVFSVCRSGSKALFAVASLLIITQGLPPAAAETATGHLGARAPGSAAHAATTSTIGTRQNWHAAFGPAQLLWTGFRAAEKNGEVLLQTSGAVTIEKQTSSASERDVAVFRLKHCRAGRRTDRLPLETRFFDSPVSRISMRQRGSDLEVRVLLRTASQAVTRQEPGPNGSSFWFLQFASPTEKSLPATALATP